ncbi:probable phospholipid-transporting ATPase IM isoform X1 [Mus musculus]|uniref:Phospholipid-transporting ATPase n=2 Tax=Mus musculus TaxID=10090 RepID=A2ANX3_MOUSE|nr:probable phospholipid-transporting ATPase IM [Mus musculus]NP_001346904.1 probable phospholipid-transporting ATPase IM [Mus musculus]XP_006499558.1 probable phospholipid-transporting ATPase IM isoform X1 [Mus musculus]|eukprot:NP_001074413.2 probable phospholipid-transporting ATPase IM [Mus musculus]
MMFCNKKKLLEVERVVKANDRDYNEKFQYADNRIHTSKYNVLTFLPINLFEQLQRVANAYFLFLLILQLIPEISSLTWFTTIVPLVLVISMTAVKDATDDYFRHKSDNQVNNRQSKVLINSKLQNEKWMNVKVGDIIKLENNQFVAADLLLLSSSEPHGLCYVETAELDGETNLKVRQALPVTSELGADISSLAEFDGIVRCEAPNNKLDRFSGVLSWKDSKHALSNQKIILRGCVLRNTSWCFGMVLFAGPDTKLMQNSGKTKFKRTSIDRLMNTLVLWIFGFLVCLGIILAVGSSILESEVGDQFRTPPFWREGEKSFLFSGFLTFWSYVIILNTLVPISLYVSVEVIRLGHSYFINWDRKMYYASKAMPAEARTTTLNEELGQIEYIFSDKTGTLTQNIMTFKKCSINGRVYAGEVLDDPIQKKEITKEKEATDFSSKSKSEKTLHFFDQSLMESIELGDPKVHEFLRLLALCHTVMSEENSAGQLVYQVQSPDEGALVTAARNFGFIFKSRTPETITIEELGTPVTYQLLAFLDFNNIRKRMSVIVRNPEGRIKLYSKGADTILFEKLHPSNEDLQSLTSDHLSEFAGEGLRTLAIAYRELDDKYFKMWQKMLEDANSATLERDERISGLYEEIERDLMLLGATAVEDKLQEGVIETITSLSLANIKIWILTGDKQETAINIGYACNVLTDAMDALFVITGNTAGEVREELRKAKENLLGQSTSFSNGHAVYDNKQRLGLDAGAGEAVTGEYALVINGHSLAHALESDVENDLLELACVCKTVVCCRVTPLQKAQVVELVKKHRNAVTLAIGDGANDVSMIKSAHIGIGISGQEGLQAVLASDYALAQFRYLQRLLLVHGRWSYYRMCKFLCYFFYKNFAFTLVHFWFAFFCGFSAQTVYDQWFITLFNIVYTSLPVLAMGMFDQDINEQNSMDYPQLYEPGQLNLLFNKRRFFICVAHGIYTSLALFFIPYGAFYNVAAEDGQHIADLQSFAVTVATSLVIVVSIQIALDTSYWTVVNHVFIWGSVATYFSILLAMHSDGVFGIFPRHFPFVGNARHSLSQKFVWLVVLLTAVTSVMPVVVVRFLKMYLYPSLSDQIRRWQKAQRKKRPLRSRRPQTRRSSSRRSGYAFAHQEGYGELITSGKNMRAKSPAPASGLEKKLYNNTSWIENLCKKTTDAVSGFSHDKTVKL